MVMVLGAGGGNGGIDSLPFRAPELFNVCTWPSELTVKSDIWSLGCVLYTMAYLENPFEVVAGQTGSVSLAIAQGKFTFPEQDPYSQRVRDLIESMLKLNPTERPTIGQVLGKVL
eukprot:m.106578 g.106578  ORF g.106578 m.106578 type:complete len:115 (+) comp27734_c0_seq2:125-469(+)